MRSWVILTAMAGLLVACETSTGDTYLQGVDGDHARSFKHDRFYSGTFPEKAFIGEPFDFSGVGRSSDGRWVTMISPRYFVSAWHYHPSTSGSTAVTFHEGNDASTGSHVYTVDSWSAETSYDGVTSDLWLGRLTADIPAEDNISSFPVLALDSDSAYVDLEIYTYGRPDRVGRNNIDRIGNKSLGGRKSVVMEFDFDAVGGIGESESYMMGGDSGGPSFVAYNGALALVGIHWYNFGNTTPVADGSVSGDTFVPYYVDQLDSLMGDGYVVRLPEAVPGDCNIDGTVDMSDLGILADNYGVTAGATWAIGDFNHDGRVDVSDLGMLAANYGQGSAVPEPASMALLAVGALAVVPMGRKRRQPAGRP